MIEILHGLGAFVHPVDAHFVAHVAEALGEQMETFLLVIAEIPHDVHRVLVGVNTGEEISIDNRREFRHPGEFYRVKHKRVKNRA